MGTKNTGNSELREQIHDYMDSYLEEVDSIGKVGEAIRDIISSRGDCYGPFVSIRVSQLYDVPLSRMIPSVFSMEFFQAAHLLTEYKLERSDGVTGMEIDSCFAKYGDAIMELCIHGLDTRAISVVNDNESLTDNQRERIIKGVLRAKGDLITGLEIGLQKDASGEKFSTDYFYRLFSLKTGSLFGHAATIGGIVGNAPYSHIPYLRRFGERLGILYQIASEVNTKGDGNRKRGIVGLLGVEEARKMAIKIGRDAKENLKHIKKVRGKQVNPKKIVHLEILVDEILC